MWQKSCAVLIIVLVRFSATFAQPITPPRFDAKIVTDRPDQTEAPQLAPVGWLQVESGTQREFDHDRASGDQSEEIKYSTTLIKYGVSRFFEARLIADVSKIKQIGKSAIDGNDSVSEASGLSGILVGAKIFIQREKGLIPHISLIGHLNLPYFGNSDLRPDVVIPEFRFVFAHNPNKKIVVSYNLGIEWRELKRESTGIYTLAFSYLLTKRLGSYVELYGFMTENSHPDHRWDAGLTYFITDHVQLDVSGGEGFTDISPDYYYSAGLSFRFASAKKFQQDKSGN